MNQIRIVEHPLLKHSLSILRDKNTGTEDFCRHAVIVSQIIIIEATKHLPMHEKSVITPLSDTQGYSMEKSLVFIPVLRSGIAMLLTAKELFPWASAGFIGLERNESTAVAHEYYKKFPPGIQDKHILILDPMLATGGSLAYTISALKNKGTKDISAACIVAAPEGIKLLADKYPDVPIYTAAVDSYLNNEKCIVPGLGDFGDRYFGT
ncbi:uracil phosphoribosyltransferase [Desulfobacterium sp. N47]|uniref:Uracil phosphoribosyltransferase n=1 Tax=uncultured Desulfobacterium sp. TaxID=201089 RepID=E1YA94_9BACT|nr:Uracil phosphoribosyltransferase [uncultured Desulfobacterium sp.]